MKKILLLAFLLVVGVTALSALFSQGLDADRPPGVPADRWVAIHDRMGIWLSSSSRVPAPGEEPARVLGGQLMANVGGVWVRVQLEQEALRFLPAR